MLDVSDFLANIGKFVEDGFVSEKEHPVYPHVKLYNYTPECQYSSLWNEYTIRCRGLVIDTKNKVLLANPFPKFHNYEEHVGAGKSVPTETPYVTTKMDGSLGICFWLKESGTWEIATRGSFTSEQAVWAKKWFDENINPTSLIKGWTYLFEIIYPENQIVVAYDFQGLVMLSARDSIDTEPDSPAQLRAVCPYLKDATNHMRMVTYHPFSSYEDLKGLNTANEEGFVLYFPSSKLRLKIKFETYILYHSVVSNLTPLAVWRILSAGESFPEDFPDELFARYDTIAQPLFGEFNKIRLQALADFYSLYRDSFDFSDRKTLALQIKEFEYPGLVFSLLDRKDVDSSIWKMIRPKGD